MILNYSGLQDREAWEKAGVALPKYDWKAMCAETAENPVWVHFGAGNIFRIFIAGLQQRLLNQGAAKAGIVAVETFDAEVVERIYAPHDSMTLAVSLKADGSIDKEIVASIAKGVVASDDAGREELKAIFRKPSLQMLSFTITEKGYALRDMKGELTPLAAADIEAGPAAPKHAMGVVASLLLERYSAGGTPIAVVSMDNCSHNGEKLRAGVTEIARRFYRQAKRIERRKFQQGGILFGQQNRFIERDQKAAAPVLRHAVDRQHIQSRPHRLRQFFIGIKISVTLLNPSLTHQCLALTIRN